MPRQFPLTPRRQLKNRPVHERTRRLARERTELIEARERLGLNRPQMSEKMGRSRSYIYRVEAGVLDPGLNTILDWMKALGPDASILLFEPHPKVEQWSKLIGKDLRKLLAQQLVA